MQQPSVTVLIPCNSTEYLSECLSSIEKQNYLQLEVLVILNGSAINDLGILRTTFKNYRFPLEFISTLTHGIVSALNLGIGHCKNEFIARMDSDDLMPDGRIGAQIAKFVSDPKLVCVGGQLEYLNNDSVKLHPGYPSRDKDIRHAMYRYSPFPHPGVMFRKSAVQRAGLYREIYPYIEDWDLWVRLSDEGGLMNLSEPTVFHRLHNNQSTAIFVCAQEESIRSLSLSVLQKTMRGHKEPDIQRAGFFEPLSAFGLLLLPKLWKKSFTSSGLFGKRDLRRALAGYVFIHSQSVKSVLLHFLLRRVVVAIIDPSLVLRKITRR